MPHACLCQKYRTWVRSTTRIPMFSKTKDSRDSTEGQAQSSVIDKYLSLQCASGHGQAIHGQACSASSFLKAAATTE